MRFAPAAAALSLALAVTSSVGWAGERAPAPRAGVLLAEGQAALEQGDVQGAIDAYEAALTVDPGYTPIFLRLAEAARAADVAVRLERYEDLWHVFQAHAGLLHSADAALQRVVDFVNSAQTDSVS